MGFYGLVWILVWKYEFLWISLVLCRTCMDFELWFYSYFWVDFGIDCRMVLCRVFGMFCGLNWNDIVAGGLGLFWDGFGSKWRVPELPRSSLARYCVEATLLSGWAQNLALRYAIAWVSTQLLSPYTPSNLQLRTIITSSSELRFGCSWTLWKIF